MYSSLSQFKDYIGIAQSDTSQDKMLTLLLNSACEQINHLCGVDSFDQDTYEEQIDARKIYVNSFWYNIFVKNKPVSSIDEIDGETYSGVKGVDYMVASQRRIIFKEFDSDCKFGFVTIKYTAWYDRAKPIEWSDQTEDTLPDDLKLMEMMLASGRYQQKWNEGISSYRLGDEQIVFGGRNGESADDMFFSFRIMLDKYKNFNLAI